MYRKKSGDFSSNFGRILAIKNLPKKTLDFNSSFFIFNIKYFKILAIESQPKKNGRLGSSSSAILWWTKSWEKDRW